MADLSREEELLAACRRGERWAQRELFERHYEAVYRVLLGQTGDPSEAEDLLQETFLRAFQAVGDFRGDARVSTWLTRIALNAFYDARRRRGLRQRLLDTGTRTGARRPGLPGSAPQEGPEEALERRERWGILRRALGTLGRRDRSVIVLCDLEGYTYAEAAAVLQVPEGTVASRLSRARARLRRAVKGLLGPGGRNPGPGSSNRRRGQGKWGRDCGGGGVAAGRGGG